MPAHYCYLLRCSDGSFYVGVTDDPERRLAEHSSGKAAAYTFRRRPVRLVWTEEHSDLKSARKREIQLKKWGHRKKEELAARFPRRR
ncbi:MAG: GIY-YIG nuclease family protein [Acidobacteria bacterium]|nr:GIY-YIG nuclease family protein [Acidobacteriota bacterium]